MDAHARPVTRIWNLVKEEKSEITAIYFYAILNGIIQLSLPLGVQAIIGFILAGTLSASLVVLISLIVTGVLCVGLITVNQMRIIEKIQQKIFVKYSFAFASKIPSLDLRQVDSYYLPELVNRFFDTVGLQKSISKLLLDLPTATIQIVFGLLLLSFYHPAFIFFGIILLFILWLILYLTGNKGLETSLEESRNKYELVGWFEEVARVVKSFKFNAGTQLHLKRADEKTGDYLQARTRHFNILLVQYRTLVVFKLAITASILIVGVGLLLNQQINIGQFVAAEIIIITVINSVEKIIINLDSVYDVLTSVEKINKLLDKPGEVSGKYSLDASGGIGVRAHQLSFGFADRPVLKALDFQVRPGEKVCLSGPDGSGKSTLLKLLTGAYTDFTGALLINNIPVANYDLTSLREKIGFLFPQENIFKGSLWENITMGRQVNRTYVTSLVQRAGLEAFLSTLPQGYDTELDPTGKRLPRNVIQKILLVRALAHQPALVLMEEPWLGIEEAYKYAIQQLIRELPDTTVIVASNDAAFCSQCDQRIQLS